MGGGEALPFKAPCHTNLPPPPRGPHSHFFIIFQAARVVIFTLGREPRGAHVGRRWGRGAGAAGLRCKSLSFCGCCSLSPPTAPLHRVFFLSSPPPFFPQRSCYGLPGRLPWVTGPRPAGSLPATQSPPQPPPPPPAELRGGRRRERACAGRGAGECARAAEAPQPTGGRGCSGGSATASGVGAKL